MDAKICGVKDSNTLKYIINHNHAPKFIGFIVNYKKSKRYIKFEKLKKLIDIDKKGINFVAVLVAPDENILEKIKNLNFDYYQLYDVTPNKTKLIKINSAYGYDTIHDTLNHGCHYQIWC